MGKSVFCLCQCGLELLLATLCFQYHMIEYSVGLPEVLRSNFSGVNFDFLFPKNACDANIDNFVYFNSLMVGWGGQRSVTRLLIFEGLRKSWENG